MKNIFVAGAGTMGLGIAEVFAAKGFFVTCYDLTDEILQRASERLEKSLSKRVGKGKLSEEEKRQLLANLKFTSSIQNAKDAEFIIEAVVENLMAKQELFKRMALVCGSNTIFATNTSSKSVTEIAAAVPDSSKFIGMHFFNPPGVMQLIEIIRGMDTSDETFKAVFDLAERLGKTPIEVREAPGFVVNRLLIPMINEAIALVAEGVASEASIDTAMRLGANHPMGPLALGDLIGLDVVLAIMDTLFEETKDPKFRAHPHLRKMVRAGRLGRKTGKGFFQY